MATKSNIKGFYKQQKSTGISKSKTKSKSASSTPKNSPTFAIDSPQTPASVSQGSPVLQGEHDENESVLRQFDMNMVYGPCLGMSRLERWERAKKLGLNPPNDLMHILFEGKNVRKDCLWAGLV